MKKLLIAVLLALLSLCLCMSALSEEETERFYDTLQYGDEGEDVLALQTRLKELGYYSGPLSGKFAEQTRKAVRNVQDAYELEVSGIADSDTQQIIFGNCYLPLSYGDKGEQVKKLQEKLIAMGYLSSKVTGNYLAQTRTAVSAFQKDAGLEATGRADAQTLTVLYTSEVAPSASAAPAPAAATPTPAGMTPLPPQAFPGTLSYGSKNSNVTKVQQRLRELGFFTYKKNTDGYYKNTQAAVKVFQKMNGLPQTGTVDEITWNILFNDPEAADASAATPRPSPAPVPAQYYFEVDVKNQVVKVWEYDSSTQDYTTLAKSFICATGTSSHPSPLGTFTLNGRRAKYCKFPTWGGGEARYWTRINSEIAFHSVLYSNAGDDSTLKVNSLKGLGKPGSHGCIRMTVADAKWIYEHAKAGMKVWIHDDAASDPELVYSVQPGSYNAQRYAPNTTPVPPVYTPYDGTKVPSGEIRQLKKGSEGEDVYWLQSKLKELGYYTGTVTGQYREGTEKAVKAYQRANGLEQSGTATKRTLETLYRQVEAANATPTPCPTAVPTAVPSVSPLTPAPSPVLTPVPVRTASPDPTATPAPAGALR